MREYLATARNNEVPEAEGRKLLNGVRRSDGAATRAACGRDDSGASGRAAAGGGRSAAVGSLDLVLELEGGHALHHLEELFLRHPLAHRAQPLEKFRADRAQALAASAFGDDGVDHDLASESGARSPPSKEEAASWK